MNHQTIEAVYNNWQIKLLDKINVKKAKLYIVVVEDSWKWVDDGFDIEKIENSEEFINTDLHKRWKKILASL